MLCPTCGCNVMSNICPICEVQPWIHHNEAKKLYGLKEDELFTYFFTKNPFDWHMYGKIYPLSEVHRLADITTVRETDLDQDPRRGLYLEMGQRMNEWREAGQRFNRRFELAKEITFDLLNKTNIQATSFTEKLIERKINAIKEKIPDPRGTDIMCIAMLVVEGLANQYDITQTAMAESSLCP